MRPREIAAIFGALLLLGATRTLSLTPDRQQVKVSLSATLDHRLSKNNLHLEAGAREYLDALIDRGIEELESDNFETDEVRLAHQNLEKLVDGLGSHESLDLDHLKQRLAGICPIYPFCKKRR